METRAVAGESEGETGKRDLRTDSNEEDEVADDDAVGKGNDEGRRWQDEREIFSPPPLLSPGVVKGTQSTTAAGLHPLASLRISVHDAVRSSFFVMDSGITSLLAILNTIEQQVTPTMRMKHGKSLGYSE
ncbi:hypothetical protein EX30DRAFT_349990 [Ascodesmis nigricans]|uniref:Uncharacterized protein n=1 Tax=Ascodesmis nigricans TaxID=341454 RepID=A0A4S2MTF7_9PEZI|nr:hypothetical protein EX30DRAFT_349990 [Ascodesmis nigricans]